MNCALWYINCRGIKVAALSLSSSFKEVNEVSTYMNERCLSNCRDKFCFPGCLN